MQNQRTNRRIAITGCTGFIGKNVVNAFLCQNIELILLVRNSGKVGFATGPRVKVVDFDLHNLDSISYSGVGSPDVLLHLAWGGLPNYNSLHHFEQELPAHYSFIKKMVLGGLGKVVVAGTCLEYGMKSGELNENMETNPTTAYGLAKDTLRKEIEQLQGTSKFEFTWARLFYVWGRGQAITSLYQQLVGALDSGAAEFDMSEGEQSRDYLPVEDVAEHLVFLSLLQDSTGLVNVCSGEPIKIRRIVENWLAERDIDLKINYGVYPYPTYEPLHFWGSTKKLDLVRKQN